jgi:hypothetical protein
MTTPQHLLHRLYDIAKSLQQMGGLALLGLGSVGIERHRLDEFSDLDFFVIVSAHLKSRLLNDLTWLATPCPIAFAFMNTADGYKLLYEDGIFCEFAIFAPEDLLTIPYSAGQVIWSAEGFDTSCLLPSPIIPKSPPSVEWQLGEALTNLYIGLMRFHRGEKLSAQRFVQHYAVDRLLELISHTQQPTEHVPMDTFAAERRFEARYPHLSDAIAACVQGYHYTPQAALAILSLLEEHFSINQALSDEIRRLAQSPTV